MCLCKGSGGPRRPRPGLLRHVCVRAEEHDLPDPAPLAAPGPSRGRPSPLARNEATAQGRDGGRVPRINVEPVRFGQAGDEADVLRDLDRAFAPYDERLAELTGLDLSAWR